MNPVGSEEFPTSTSIMPFLKKMFKPKRSRSYVPSERFSDDSELYDQVPAYGSLPNGTSGFNHSAPVNRSRSGSQHYASSQTQHYPRHGSTLRSSGREQYAQPEVQDQVRHAYKLPLRTVSKYVIVLVPGRASELSQPQRFTSRLLF
jgi:hypothetical protein